MKFNLKIFVFYLIFTLASLRLSSVLAVESPVVDQAISNPPPQEANTDLLQNNTKEILKNPFKPQLPPPKVEVRELTPVTTVQQTPQPVDVTPVTPTPVVPQVKPPEFTISGLVWNCPKPEVIINQQIVGIGDTIDNWTVTAINESEIEVKSNEVSLKIYANFDGDLGGKKL